MLSLEFLEKLDWKKTAVLLIFSGTVMFIFMIYSIITSPGNLDQKEKSLVSPTPASGFEDRIRPEQKILQHNTTELQVRYPIDWNLSESEIVGGGKAIVISKIGKEGEAFPRVDIQIFPKKSENDLRQRISYLENSGFSPSEQNFIGNKAVRFEQKLEGKDFFSGNPDKKNVDKIIYLFEKGENVYLVDYSFYEEPDFSNVMEEINKIIKSLKIF